MGDRLYDFEIETLGEAKLQSPIRMSHQGGDGMADRGRGRQEAACP